MFKIYDNILNNSKFSLETKDSITRKSAKENDDTQPKTKHLH